MAREHDVATPGEITQVENNVPLLELLVASDAKNIVVDLLADGFLVLLEKMELLRGFFDDQRFVVVSLVLVLRENEANKLQMLRISDVVANVKPEDLGEIKLAYIFPEDLVVILIQLYFFDATSQFDVVLGVLVLVDDLHGGLEFRQLLVQLGRRF